MTHDAAVLEDRDRLQEWLAFRGFIPYVDFEILSVHLEEASVEIDPMGNLARLVPALEEFAVSAGFSVMPFDPETGTVSVLRDR